jgi:hypothetical protein
MPEIKFSHLYPKLLSTDTTLIKPVAGARLLLVVEVERADLPGCFIDYDTNFGQYRLPEKGLFIMLVFQKEQASQSRDLFTTLRPYTAEKAKWYLSQVGQTFDIVMAAGAKFKEQGPDDPAQEELPLAGGGQ